MIKINKGKIISYFIFVSIATLFWISTVLNKKSSYSKDIWIELITPDSLVILNGNTYKANITLEGRGMDLIFENRHSKKNPLKISLPSNARTISEDDIVKSLSKETSKRNIIIQNIIFPLKALSIDTKISKQVAVKFAGKYSFKNLFGLKSGISLNPDKITITGPKTYIDKITKWNTENKTFDKITHTVVEDIKLKKPMSSKIHLSEDKVLLTIPVEQFTEKKMMLPVSIAGNNQKAYEILPPFVEVSFLIGLSRFDSIEPSDFKANIYVEGDSILSVSYPVSIIKKPKLASIQYTRPGYVDVYLKNNQE